MTYAGTKDNMIEIERNRRNAQIEEQKRFTIAWILDESSKYTREELNAMTANEVKAIKWDIENANAPKVSQELIDKKVECPKANKLVDTIMAIVEEKGLDYTREYVSGLNVIQAHCLYNKINK